jgi:UDP-glucose 4-epimerase
LADIFKGHSIHGVIHFAGHKTVAESQAKRLLYYDNNLAEALSY